MVMEVMAKLLLGLINMDQHKFVIRSSSFTGKLESVQYL